MEILDSNVKPVAVDLQDISVYNALKSPETIIPEVKSHVHP